MQEKKKYRFLLIVFAALLFVTFLWYPNNSWTTLMGDDLIAVTGFKSLGFWGMMTHPADIEMGKIRPIQKIILYIVYLCGGTEYKTHYVIARLFVFLLSLITYFVMRKMNIRPVFSLLASTLIIICPFSAYGAWQYIGITESFSCVCCLFIAYNTYLLLFQNDARKDFFISVKTAIWFALLIFNAERFMYIIIVPFIVVLIKKNTKMAVRIAEATCLISPVLLRSIILIALGSNPLGTGRSDIRTMLSTIIAYAVKGLINMLGFSLGDPWHGGFLYMQLPAWTIVVAAIRVFVFVGVLFLSLHKVIHNKNERLVYLDIVIWYLFSLTSLFSYALVASTHGEDRFLWVSYLFYLIALSKYLMIEIRESSERDRKLSKLMVVIPFSALLIGTIFTHVFYHGAKKLVHFRYSQELSQTAYDSITSVENYSSAKNYVFVSKNDYGWVFYGNSFIQYYIDASAEAYYCNSIEELRNSYDLYGKETIVVIYQEAEHPGPYAAEAFWIDDFLNIS